MRCTTTCSKWQTLCLSEVCAYYWQPWQGSYQASQHSLLLGQWLAKVCECGQRRVYRHCSNNTKFTLCGNLGRDNTQTVHPWKPYVACFAWSCIKCNGLCQFIYLFFDAVKRRCGNGKDFYVIKYILGLGRKDAKNLFWIKYMYVSWAWSWKWQQPRFF